MVQMADVNDVGLQSVEQPPEKTVYFRVTVSVSGPCQVHDMERHARIVGGLFLNHSVIRDECIFLPGEDVHLMAV